MKDRNRLSPNTTQAAEDSILSLVIDKNLKALKELANKGADISITGNLQLGNQTLEEVIPLFAASTSGHEEIVQNLVIQSQNCKFKKEPDLETLAPHVSQKNSSSSLIISN